MSWGVCALALVGCPPGSVMVCVCALALVGCPPGNIMVCVCTGSGWVSTR